MAEEIVDCFEGAKLTWLLKSSCSRKKSGSSTVVVGWRNLFSLPTFAGELMKGDDSVAALQGLALLVF